MARERVGQLDLAFPLDKRRESPHVFVAGHEVRREMPGVATDIVGHDFDDEIADRHGTKKIGGQARQVGKAMNLRRLLQGTADQRDGWSRVLVFGVPGAAGQRARVITARIKRGIRGGRR